MFIRTQNIYSLNNPINLAILLILVQIINKNFIPPYNLGVTYGKKGKVDKAIENYDKTIELNPNYAVAYSNRGNVYTNKGEMENAMKDYKTRQIATWHS